MPSQPEPNQPIFLTEEQVQFRIDGSLTSAPARVTQQLWPRPGVTIKVSGVTRNPQPISESSSESDSKRVVRYPITSEGPAKVQLENGVWVAVVPTSWITFQQEAELHLQQNPSTVLDTGKPITRLQFDLLNVTGDLFNWPLPLQAQSSMVQIKPVPNLIELEKVLRTDSGYAVTHRAMVQRSEGEPFSRYEAEIFLRGLEHFVSFACGSQCGATNVVGFDAQGDEAWKQWGSYHVSPWVRRRSWSDVTVRGDLAEMFERFSLKYSKDREHLDRILGWYLYSNESSAQDLSIVLNQTVLEILTSVMPGGTGKKPGERIAALLCKHGIDPQIPDAFSELTLLANQNGFEHGPHSLVAIRNSMVHPDTKVEMNTIDTYHEAKQLGLWYIELLLLRMFEYDGEYASRLVDVHLAGATEPLPWSNQFNLDDGNAH